MAAPSDDSQFLSVLSVFCFLIHAWPAVVRGKQVMLQLKWNHQNNEVVSLNGQQRGRIMLFGEMPLCQSGIVSICAFKQCQDGTSLRPFSAITLVC